MKYFSKISHHLLTGVFLLFICNCYSIPMHDGSPVRSMGIAEMAVWIPHGTYTYPAPGFTGPIDDLGSKMGSSCITQNYLGYYIPMGVKGDMSVYAAAKAGNISKVKLVSYQVRRIPNLFGYLFFNDSVQYCTIVHGD